jgi:hypothetical protein
MASRAVAVLLGCVLFTLGCALRPTGYVAASYRNSNYGYSDNSEGSDDYSILVKGNEATSAERVAQLALLRAAYLTLEKGGNRFTIIHSESLAAQFDRLTAFPLWGVSIPVSTGTSESKIAALVIHVLHPDTAPAAPGVLDAQMIVADLSAKVQR